MGPALSRWLARGHICVLSRDDDCAEHRSLECTFNGLPSFVSTQTSVHRKATCRSVACASPRFKLSKTASWMPAPVHCFEADYPHSTLMTCNLLINSVGTALSWGRATQGCPTAPKDMPSTSNANSSCLFCPLAWSWSTVSAITKCIPASTRAS